MAKRSAGKIAVISDLASGMAFRSLGMVVLPVAHEEDPLPILEKAVASGEYAIIYLAEEVAASCQQSLLRWQDQLEPAIIPIPSAKAASGYGLSNLREAAKRAIGFDILESPTFLSGPSASDQTTEA